MCLGLPTNGHFVPKLQHFKLIYTYTYLCICILHTRSHFFKHTYQKGKSWYIITSLDFLRTDFQDKTRSVESDADGSWCAMMEVMKCQLSKVPREMREGETLVFQWQCSPAVSLHSLQPLRSLCESACAISTTCGHTLPHPLEYRY